MKITLIRHGKVDMEWKKKYSSKEYDADCAKYDNADILPIVESQCSVERSAVGNHPVYISSLKRTRETAKGLFGDRTFIETTLLNEVPMRSFRDTEGQYSVKLFDVVGRIQWLINSKRQPEKRKMTEQRAEKLIMQLEQKQEDCFLITHGFYMHTLIKILKRNGYEIHREQRSSITNLEAIEAIKTEK